MAKTVSGVEIPFWIFGQQKWVSGINKNTTCQEVRRKTASKYFIIGLDQRPGFNLQGVKIVISSCNLQIELAGFNGQDLNHNFIIFLASNNTHHQIYSKQYYRASMKHNYLSTICVY